MWIHRCMLSSCDQPNTLKQSLVLSEWMCQKQPSLLLQVRWMHCIYFEPTCQSHKQNHLYLSMQPTKHHYKDYCICLCNQLNTLGRVGFPVPLIMTHQKPKISKRAPFGQLHVLLASASVNIQQHPGRPVEPDLSFSSQPGRRMQAEDSRSMSQSHSPAILRPLMHSTKHNPCILYMRSCNLTFSKNLYQHSMHPLIQDIPYRSAKSHPKNQIHPYFLQLLNPLNLLPLIQVIGTRL